MKRFFLLFLSVFAMLFIGAKDLNAKVYHIEFKSGYDSGTSLSYNPSITSVLSSTDDLVNVYSYGGNVYYQSSKGLRFVNPASLTLNFKKTISINKITILSHRYSDDNTDYIFSIYNENETISINPNFGESFNISFETTKEMSGIIIETKENRGYISQIILETKEERTLYTDNESVYWATFSSNQGAFFLDPVEVKTAEMEGGILSLATIKNEEYKGESGTYVAANTGVLLKSSNNTASYYDIEENIVDTYSTNNMLHASSNIISGEYIYYVLSKGENGKIGFYWDNENGTLTETWAGGAYLAIPRGNASSRSFTLDDMEEGIESIAADKSFKTGFYSVDGKKFGDGDKPSSKGLFISDGKIIMVK